MANFRLFTDKDQDIWVEFPPGSRMLYSLEEKVLRELAHKHRPMPIPEAAENYGPLAELN
jgi:hypothetical protein